MTLFSNGVTTTLPWETSKNALIDDILCEEDLYKVLGASPSCTSPELRRCYLERSKICHPDKPPFHPQSTRAFQKLGFAFEILKTPSSRRSYDAALRPASTSQRHGDAPAFLGGDYTFRTAVDALISDFVTGDFVLVRKALSALHKQYPNLVSLATVSHVEHAFVRIRELALAARTHALLIYIELRRIRRVQLRLSALGYLDVLGRARLTIELVRVTLAVPVRVDRALKTRAQKEWKSRTAGLSAAGLPLPEVEGRAGILNENVCKVLEFIVGEASCDKEADEADEAWDTSATAPPRAA